MLSVFGAICSTDIEPLRKEIPAQWLAAWDACHKVGKNEKNALLSLSALSLLHRAGADGTLVYGENGRPYFEARTCDFSITHTQNHVFCAIIEGEEPTRIGIDAEDLDRPDLSNFADLAARWFAEGEQNILFTSPTKETFLRIWTRKEAYVKYTGEGLRGLKAADTTATSDVCFFDFCEGTTLISICAPRNTTPPTEIIIVEKE